jgi:hypothetical protein
MAVEMKVARTGPAILDALQEAAPDEAPVFAAEYRDALRRAASSLDLSESDQVLNRWWGIAYLRLNPPSDEDREIGRRLDAGEDVGWPTPGEWVAARGR